MALEASEVRVGVTGHLYTNTVGVAFPTNIDTALSPNAGWRELGYTTEDGPKFSFSRDVNEIMGWQSFDPLRQVVTRVPKSVSAELMQINQNTWNLAFGGGTWSSSGAGVYEYEPPDEAEVDERAFVVEFEDGDFHYRFCFRRAINVAEVTFPLQRSEAITLPIEMKILAADGGAKPYLVQTDDPNLGLVLEAGS